MKELDTKTRALSSLLKEIQKEKYDFNHPLQRESKQWNRLRESKLIDSAIRLYPIYPVLITKDDDSEKLGVIDGKQRLTTLSSYYNNEFSLSKTLEPIIIDGESYEIAGKKYDKLDDNVKDRFLNREIQLYIMSNPTDEDIREIFARINTGGKQLSPAQIRPTIESDELRKIVFDLTETTFMNNVSTKPMVKSAADRDIIRQVLFMTETAKYPMTSFRTKDMDEFIKYYNDNIDADKIAIVKQALEKLAELNEDIKFTKLMIPIVIFGMYKSIKDKRSTEKYLNFVKEFSQNYENYQDFTKYTQTGTASHDMVIGRIEFIKKIVNGL